MQTPAQSGGKGKNDLAAKRQVLDIVQESMSFTQGLLVSALPRCSLHIVQPGRVPEPLLKGYTTDFHREDRASWQAILQNKVLRGPAAFGKDMASTRFYRDFLAPLGLRHVLAAPVKDPVLDGYPGAVLLLRSEADGDFSESEAHQLGRLVSEAEDVLQRGRHGREGADNGEPWTHKVPVRFGVFNGEGDAIWPSEGLALDDRLEAQMRQRARIAIEQYKKGHVMADRVLLPDTWGDLWVFRGVLYPEFPAIGPGPKIIFCLQPESAEWAAVRPAEVQADPEIVRLLPAIRYMQQEFSSTPTLSDISKKAHLSPFHFHRRFTDLIGQTPKHFLLSCQIKQAKRMLISRKRELAKIATDCGFAHQSHFTSRFKQATGLTPTRWRRLAAQISEGAGNN